MIGFFPEMWPDELLYSVLARYRRCLRYPSEQSVMTDLFGSPTLRAAASFPSHLDRLIERLPQGHGYTADGLIRDHTLLPYYERFLSPGTRARVRETMRGQRGGRVAMLLGIVGRGAGVKRGLHYCPECVLRDRAERSEPYWRRVHQVPAAVVCPWHECLLVGCGVRPAEAGRCYHALEDAVHGLPAAPAFPPADEALLLDLARDALWLLGGSDNALETDLRAAYRGRLAAGGWMRSGGHVRFGDLHAAFVERFSPDLLATLGCAAPRQEGDNWLGRLLRRSTDAQPPLHHMLLIRFLGASAEEFLGTSPGRTPPPPVSGPTVPQAGGRGSRTACERGLCLNPVCPRQAGLAEISGCACGDLDALVRTRCPACGFAAAFRPGSPARRRVLDYGPAWERRLGKLAADPACSLDEIARTLGVARDTALRQARRLEVARPEWLQAAAVVLRTAPAANTRRLQRERILLLRRDHPRAGRNQLRALAPAACQSLYRTDRQWYERHMPPRRSAVRRLKRVDWRARDAQLVEQCRKAVASIRGLEPPQRVSYRRLARDLGGIQWIPKELARLPKCRAYLSGVIESRAGFALRRLRWAAERLKGRGVVVSRCALLRESGIGLPMLKRLWQ
jgi:hypothetical protein